MLSVRKLVIYSTFPALFSSAMVLDAGGIKVQFFYFLLIFNLLLMLYLGRVWIPKGLPILVAFVLASGVAGIVMGSDTIALFMKQLVGVSVSCLYFCCFMYLMNFDAEECFRKYAQTAYYVALIGLILFPLQYIFLGNTRLQSVLSEPSMFAITCLPALYYYADTWQRHRREGRKLLALGVAFVLAGSSVGFLGILFGMCIFGTRYRRSVALVPVLIAGIGLGVYTVSADFRMRLDDTVKSTKAVDVADANLSTFALVSNAFVTVQSLREHPLIGTGAGSHPLSYEKFIGSLPGIEVFEDTSVIGINAPDANSMFLRVASEFGIVGILLLFWFIWRNRAQEGQDRKTISQAIWVYFFVKLLRAGAYFSPEQFFFIVLYSVNRYRLPNLPADASQRNAQLSV